MYHDKFQSIVTVGGFDSQGDPRIRTVAETYRAKIKPDPQGNGKQETLTPETKILRAQGAPITAQPLHVWAFDPEPRLIEVPHIK